LACCAWLGLCFSLWPAPAAAQQIPWRVVAQPDGLSNLVVTALTQDSSGYLWIGTDSGLFRFDGKRAVRVPGSEGVTLRTINALHLGPQGELWVGTPKGLFMSSSAPGAPWRELRSAGGALAVEHGQAMANAGDGSLLLVSERKLWRVRRAGAGFELQATPFFDSGSTDPGAVAGLLQRPDGLWFGCGESLCTWNGRALRRFGVADGVPAAGWRTLIQDSAGGLWARAGGHVVALPAGRQRFVDRSLAGTDRRVLNVAQPLVADREGGVVTYTDEGLARWDGQRWHAIGTAQGLAVGGGGALAFWLDAHGSLWVGTAGRGLAQWRGYPHARVWDKLPGDEAWTFLEDRQRRMHIGTGSGLVEIAGDGRPSDERIHARAQQVGAMVEDAQGRLWFGSFAGELRRRDKPGATDELVAKLPLIFRLLIDRQGNLWVATQRGVYRIAAGEPGAQPELMPFEVLASRRGAPQTFWSCESPDGAVWFATAEGLLRHRDGQWTHVRPWREDLQREQAMPANTLACGAGGEIWVGSGDEGRLWKLAPRSGHDGAWQAEDRSPEALSDRQLYALLLDRRGGLWLATAQGLLLHQGDEWHSVREQDGLLSDDCNQLALYEARDGAIWVGSSRGATRWVPPARWPQPATPVMASADHGERKLGSGAVLSLPWSNEPLVLTLDLPDLRAGPDQRVRYWLQGLEERPHTTSGRELRYAALPPGRYRLSAWTEWVDTGQLSPPLQVDIDVTPPWWRTTWATAAGVAGVLLLLLAGHHWRLQRFRKRQEELEALVGERTREVEASRDALHELAMKDALTGLWNRRALMERLESELERCKRAQVALTLVLCDADHFKRINDTHGHLVGDQVLREIARRLQSRTRGYDCVGRYGGEEFLLLLPELNLAREPDRRRLDSMRAAIADEPVTMEDPPLSLRVSCSFGAVTVWPPGERAMQALVHEADTALYQAKAQGRNCVVVA
jgi:diguanylate cyclase (GGDEF)-like protein